MTNNITFTLDLTNPAHATWMAQALASATPLGVTFTMGTDVPAPTQVSTPVAEPKTYAPAQDVQCVWVQDKTKVSYTLADGKYVGQTGARKTLNARLREAGATYDASVKAWKFASSKKAEEFVTNTSALVTAAEIEGVRAKAQARALKKAQA